MKKKNTKKVKSAEDRINLAFAACKTLIAAYDAGEKNGGEMEWDDVDMAYELALEALGKKEE